MPMPMPAPAALPVPLSGPAATLQTRLAPAAADPLAAGMFADLVQNEMVTMLNQMYAEMNVTNPMSLEQLAAANPSLHAQIRAKAEETARAVMAQRKLSASPVQAAGGGGGYTGPSRGPGYYPPVASPQAVYPAQPTHAAVAGRKRAADYPDQYATQSGVYRGAPSEGFGPAGAGRYPPAQQQYPSQVQYSSRFNAPIAGARSTRPYPGNNGYPPSQAPAYNYPRATGPSPQFPARDSRALDLDEEELSPEQEEAEHAELLRRRAEESRYYEELRVKYASDHFVNGFLSEAPVVVDVARVQALHDVLRSQYCNQTHIDNNDIVGDASRNVRVKIEGAESKTSTSSAVDSGSAESKSEGEAVKLSEGFRAASHTVTQRLGSYLRDIQTPPRLPQILFGECSARVRCFSYCFAACIYTLCVVVHQVLCRWCLSTACPRRLRTSRRASGLATPPPLPGRRSPTRAHKCGKQRRFRSRPSGTCMHKVPCQEGILVYASFPFLSTVWRSWVATRRRWCTRCTPASRTSSTRTACASRRSPS
jgi:hypothetical protein